MDERDSEDVGTTESCPNCGYALLPFDLATGAVVVGCRNCGQVVL